MASYATPYQYPSSESKPPFQLSPTNTIIALVLFPFGMIIFAVAGILFGRWTRRESSDLQKQYLRQEGWKTRDEELREQSRTTNQRGSQTRTDQSSEPPPAVPRQNPPQGAQSGRNDHQHNGRDETENTEVDIPSYISEHSRQEDEEARAALEREGVNRQEGRAQRS